MRLLSALWEAMFPYIPRCVVCGTEKNVADFLCPSCEKELTSLRLGKIDATGLPAYSSYRYNGAAAHIVQGYKYGGSRWLSAFMAQAMLREAAQAQTFFDCICNVPLHKKRQHKRGFDQAALLAKRIAALTGKPYVDAIKRIRNTPSQTKLNAEQRKENMHGAFELVQAVQGHVLLIDDVLTTGATTAACADVLKAAGAKSVTVLTFARADKIDKTPAVSR